MASREVGFHYDEKAWLSGTHHFQRGWPSPDNIRVISTLPACRRGFEVVSQLPCDRRWLT